MRITEDCEDTFCKTTIKNVGDDDRVLWVHLAYTYFASLIVAYFVYRCAPPSSSTPAPLF